MSSYKIYLTKSSDVAHLISDSLRLSRFEGTISTGSGMVLSDVRIPPIYHDKGYFYAMIEYKSGNDLDNPKYEIIVA